MSPPSCNICYEELKGEERDFYPCSCGFQVCLWCVNEIKISCDRDVCPSCRKTYNPSEFESNKKKWVELNGSKKDALVGRTIGSPAPKAPSLNNNTLHNLPMTIFNAVLIGGLPKKSLSKCLFPLPDDGGDTTGCLASEEHFGKHGSILDMKAMLLPEHRDLPESLSGTVVVWVSYQSVLQAERALLHYISTHPCGPVVMKYCPSLVSGRKCNAGNKCAFLHSTYRPPLYLTTDAKEIDPQTGFQRRLGHLCSRDLTSNIQFLLLDILNGNYKSSGSTMSKVSSPHSTSKINSSASGASSSTAFKKSSAGNYVHNPTVSGGYQSPTVTATAVPTGPVTPGTTPTTANNCSVTSNVQADNSWNHRFASSPTIIKPPTRSLNWGYPGTSPEVAGGAPGYDEGQQRPALPPRDIEDMISHRVASSQQQRKAEKKKKQISNVYESPKSKIITMDESFFSEVKSMKDLGKAAITEAQQFGSNKYGGDDECDNGDIDEGSPSTKFQAGMTYEDIQRLINSHSFIFFDLLDVNEAWKKKTDNNEQQNDKNKSCLSTEMKEVFDKMTNQDRSKRYNIQMLERVKGAVAEESSFIDNFSVKHLETYVDNRLDDALTVLDETNNEHNYRTMRESEMRARPFIDSLTNRHWSSVPGKSFRTAVAFGAAVETHKERAQSLLGVNHIEDTFLTNAFEQKRCESGQPYEYRPFIAFPSHEELISLQAHCLSLKIPFASSKYANCPTLTPLEVRK